MENTIRPQTYLVKLRKDLLKPKEQKNLIAEMKRSDDFNILKEIKSDDGQILSVDVSDVKNFNNLNKITDQIDNIIIEKTQVLRKMDINISWYRSTYERLKSFFLTKPIIKSWGINNSPFPETELQNYASLTNNQFQINKKLWNVNISRAYFAWQYGYTGKGIRVAVVDTGISRHTCLDPAVVDGFNTIGPGAITYDFTDNQTHGSHVSSTTGAENPNNDINLIYGIAPECTIIPVKVLGDDGSGNIEDIIEALELLKDKNIDVINMSLGGGEYSQIFHETLKNLAARGIVVVCATGNESSDVGFPAKYPECIPVGSHNAYNKISYFSNYGPDLAERGIVAPGEKIYGCNLKNGFTYLSGTSMATPAVTGTVALLKQINKSKVNLDVARQALRQGSVQILGIDADHQGSGRLDVPNSIIACHKILEDNLKKNDIKIQEVIGPKFSLGCRGDYIHNLQVILNSKKLYLDSLDGIYGPNMAKAVLGFTNNRVNYIDGEVYKQLTGSEFPELFERCLNITSSFEGTGYTKIIGSFDGNKTILTYGKIGFTLGYGDLIQLLINIYAKDSNAIYKSFGEYNGYILTGLIINYIKTQNMNDFIKWGLSIQDSKFNVSHKWKQGFDALGRTKIGEDCQKELAKTIYWSRATSLAEKFCLNEELSFGLLYDACVQGFSKKTEGIVSSEIFDEKTIIKAYYKEIKSMGIHASNILSEQEKRKMIATINANTCNPRWKNDVWSRRKLFITGSDVSEVHGIKYCLKNWGLETE